MSLSIKLIKLINDLRCRVSDVSCPLSKLSNLYYQACMNRIGFYFLSLLHENGFLSQFLAKDYLKLKVKHERIMEKFVQVSSDLESLRVDFAIFKSIKPYPTTTVDIDIIIFDGFKEAFNGLLDNGYTLLGYGPESVTLRDPDGIVGIDLYNEIAISKFVYFDKEYLRRFKVKVDFNGFGEVVTLSREADLLVTILHAVMKEWMFTIADYLTITYQLNNITFDVLERTALETFCSRAFYLAIGISNVLHKIVNSEDLVKFKENHVLGFELGRLYRNNFELPHKFHPLTVIQVLLERLHDEKSRRSVISQFSYLANRRRARFFLDMLINHLVRTTY